MGLASKIHRLDLSGDYSDLISDSIYCVLIGAFQFPEERNHNSPKTLSHFICTLVVVCSRQKVNRSTANWTPRNKVCNGHPSFQGTWILWYWVSSKKLLAVQKHWSGSPVSETVLKKSVARIRTEIGQKGWLELPIGRPSATIALELLRWAPRSPNLGQNWPECGS